MKALLIAEKPSLMREIQDVYRQINHPDTIIFKSFAGHVIGLQNPREYGVVNGVDWSEKLWNDNMLPMIPDTFRYKISSDKLTMYRDLKREIDSGQYDYIINACDPDREGNHIFQLFYDYSKCTLPVKRFWTNDLSFGRVEAALLNLRSEGDGLKPDLKHLTEAAVLRSWSDWLFGMNFTIATSLMMHTTVKVGRVKTATHMILGQRENEIKNFQPKTTYELESLYKEGFSGVLFDEDGNVRFETKKDADGILKQLGKTAVVESVEKKREKTNAPQLYKLSDLQTDASKAFGYNADKVLDLAQSLYEKKVLSYPRTDCRYLGTELAKDFDKLLKSIATLPELKPYVDKLTKTELDKVKKNKRYVNDAELAKSGHYALSPTTVKPDWNKLTKDERNLLTLVFKRFLAIFLDPMVCDKTIVVTNNNGHTFKTNGKVLVSKGYTVLYNTQTVDNILPPLKKNDVVNVDKFELKDKTTTCPQRYTQGSLIAAMENPGKFLNDESLKDIIKEKQGIGTPATRSSIIQNLLDDGYVEEKKGKGKAAYLYVTDKGMRIYDRLKNEEFASVDMTGIWEEKLSKVAEGKLNAKVFEKDLKDYVRKTVDYIKNKNKETKIGKCPKCNGDFVEKGRQYKCKDCELSFAKCVKEREILIEDAKKIISGKIVEKNGLKFSIKDDKFSVEAAVNKTDFTCPLCGATVKDTGKFYICEHYKSPCSFCLSRELNGATFTPDDIEKMLEGETVKKKFKWKSGKTSTNEVKLVKENGKMSYKILFN